jgi:hypothetical protein
MNKLLFRIHALQKEWEFYFFDWGSAWMMQLPMVAVFGWDGRIRPSLDVPCRKRRHFLLAIVVADCKRQTARNLSDLAVQALLIET